MIHFFDKIAEYIQQERDRLFLWLTVIFGSGIGVYFSLSSEPSLWISAIIIEVLIICAYLFRFRPFILYIIGIVSIFFAGFLNIQLKTHYLSSVPPLTTPTTDYIKGRIIKLDHNYHGQQRVVLHNPTNFDNKIYKGNYRITLREKTLPLTLGDQIELVAKLMPLPTTSLVGGYQFDRKLFFEKINGNGYSVSSTNIISPSPKTNLIYQLRQRIIKRINNILPPDEAGIAAAIIAGSRDSISLQINNNYRDSGLAHFLSISGLHMTMLAGLMFFFIRFLIALIPPLALRYDSKKISAYAAILLSSFYLIISGAEIPTQRAFIMTLIVLIGVLIGRQAISIRTISWAAFIILILSPQAIIGASFQMSFAAVTLLVAFYEHNATRLHQFLNGRSHYNIGVINRLFRVMIAYLLGIIISDFIASFATLPFAIYHFNRIAIYTSLANFLAGPIIGLIIMPFVLISLLLMPLGLDYIPLQIVGYGINIVNQITAYVSSLPNAGYQVSSIPLWGLLLITFGGLWLCLWQHSWRHWGWIGIILGFLSIFQTQTPLAMINEDGLLFAIRDKQNNLIILPRRGKTFNKQLWQEKTASPPLSKAQQQLLTQIWRGEHTQKDWLDLECNHNYCTYINKFCYYKNGILEIDGNRFDTHTTGGAIFYQQGKFTTIKDYVGTRPWNRFNYEP